MADYAAIFNEMLPRVEIAVDGDMAVGSLGHHIRIDGPNTDDHCIAAIRHKCAEAAAIIATWPTPDHKFGFCGGESVSRKTILDDLGFKHD